MVDVSIPRTAIVALIVDDDCDRAPPGLGEKFLIFGNKLLLGRILLITNCRNDDSAP